MLLLLMLLLLVILFLMVLVSIAFVTLMERKILGYIQLRKGPNKLILKGVLQPMADGMKLFLKEDFLNLNVNKMMYNFFPLLGFFLMLSFWGLFLNFFKQDILLGVIYVMVISGVSIFVILGSGWSSNSKYALLGSYRSVAQVISYEVSMVFLFISLVYSLGSYNMSSFVLMKSVSLQSVLGEWFFFFIWLVVMLAELNRAPFDFAEGESELVSGFNVEYGGGKFALIFLAEYGNIIFMSYFTMLVFLNFYLFFSLLLMLVLVIWVRGVFPRYRYDNLMFLGWKVFLPFVLMMVLFKGMIMLVFF